MRRRNWLQKTLLRWQQELADEGVRLSGGRPAPATPYYILELTPDCTQNCRYCYNVWKIWHDFLAGEMNTQEWCDLIAKLQDETGCRLVTFSGGEPLLRDDFRDILAFCHRRKLESILITNGGLLDDDTLAFCLDHGVTMFEVTLLGDNAETHDALTRTPGSWKRALAAMTRLYKAEATWCGVLVATHENIGQTRQVLEMMIALGATAIMFNRFNPGGEGARHLDLMPSVEQVQDALAVVDELAAAYSLFVSASISIMPCLIDTSPYRHVGFGFCAAGRENAYYTIGPGGRVRPCNHTATILGDLRSQSMAEILSGPTLAEFTSAVPDVCRLCPGLSTCRAGCRAAAEVCFGSLSEPEPWLRANLDRLSPNRG
ncbi:MAG: radical SAM protein [Chloroflexi bacterium]|nr:radical SAM protein [Chloroflexota bacterium]